MKYILVILLLCFGTYDKKAFSDDNFPAIVIAGAYIQQQQQEPFYFVNPIPPAKKLLDNIDLSFFKNRLAVSTYRYRIQIPNGAETSIDRRLSVWSGWTRSDLTEIKIPRLDLEGGYKLIVEYNQVEGNETRRFEVPFYVYYSSPVRTASNTAYAEKAIPVTATRETQPTTESVAEKKTGSARPATSDDNAEAGNVITEPVRPAPANRNLRKKDSLRELNPVKLAVNIKPQIVTAQPQEMSTDEPESAYPVIVTEINDSLLIPAETIDTVYIAEFLPEPLEIIPIEPGSKIENYPPPDSIENDSTAVSAYISDLPVNLTDNNGNNALHLAIISGQNENARGLISGGTDMNLKNNSGFAPMHIAVMLNNEEIVKYLILHGADINAAGNWGYTPLHIASELNYFDTASDLIFNGARTDLRTDQGLTPMMIARIQGNREIAKLLSVRDSVFLPFLRPSPDVNIINSGPALTSRIFEFNLPYDNNLIRKRKTNNVIRFIAAPVFVISTSGYLSLKSKANNNFSLSRIAETEAMAKTLYDKGVQYNKTANLTAGVSLISVYAIIHTTLRKKNITTKMAKVF